MSKELKNYKFVFILSLVFIMLGYTWVRADEADISTDSNVSAESGLLENIEPAITPTEVLPELEPVKSIGVVSETIADTKEELTVIVDEFEVENIKNMVEIIDVETRGADIASTGLDVSIASGSEPIPVLIPDKIASSGGSVLSTEEATKLVTEELSSQKEPLVILPSEVSFSENELVDTAYSVDTAIIRQPIFKGPTVIAQWQMSALSEGLIAGRDDSIFSGSQLLPSGGYQISRPYSICALVSDGFGEIESVGATINYPQNIALEIDEEDRGCGRQKSFLQLEKLEQKEAVLLFCDNIRLYNNNLPAWNIDSSKDYTYSYEQICSRDGLIQSDQALVFCGKDEFFYDDPAGDYEVALTVRNNLDQAQTNYNSLKYLELTMFEADFSDFQYGLVEEMNWKTVFGDNIWEKFSAPTIRNIGNTRLEIIIDQNDFGFGQTGQEWNISYQARIGEAKQFTVYAPDVIQKIINPINLGASVKMDFGVFVKRFPDQPIAAFSGKMILAAEKTDSLVCGLP